MDSEEHKESIRYEHAECKKSIRYEHSPIAHSRGIRVYRLAAASDYDAPLEGTFVEAFLPAESFLALLKRRAMDRGCGDLSEVSRKDLAEVCRASSPSMDYTALSYVWDPENEHICDEKVYCNDSSINVTKNCRDALRHLRSSNEVTTVWVDALCIDHQSVNERNQQVARMGSIIQAAAARVVWLGCEMEWRDFVTTPASRDIFASVRGVWPYCWLQRVLCNAEAVPPPPGLIHEMVLNPWYHRVWTVQEELLPSRGPIILKVGKSEMTLVDAEKKGCRWYDGSWFQGLDRNKRSNMYQFDVLRSKVHRSYTNALRLAHPSWQQLRLVWMQMLQLQKSQICSDPRDKLYGIFSALEALQMPLPSPDYSRPVWAVYEDVTRHVISQERGLWFILSGLGVEKDLRLPSWVPDWSMHSSKNDFAIFGGLELVFGNRNANAGSALDLEALASSGPGELRVKGQVLYEIERSSLRVGSCPLYLTSSFSEWREHSMPALWLSWSRLALCYSQSEALYRMLLTPRSTQVVEHTSDGLPSVSLSSFSPINSKPSKHRPHHDRMLRALIHAVSDNKREEEMLQSRENLDFLAQIFSNWRGAILFALSDGTLGVTWGALREDIGMETPSRVRCFAAVIAGSNVPVLVRRRSAHTPNWRLLGPAYIPKYMKWQPDSGEAALETIIFD